MTPDQIKLGLPVTYYGAILEDGTRLYPKETTIRSEPWQLGCGEWICKIDGMAGGVSLDHLFPREVERGVYIIRVQAQEPCWIAGWDGDPGRTLVRDNARSFVTLTAANMERNKLAKKYPNRAFSLDFTPFQR